MFCRYLGKVDILEKIKYYLFAVVLLSSLFQFYCFNVSGSWFSLTTILTLLLAILIIKNRTLLEFRILYPLIFIILFQLISFIWSSNIKLGLRTIMDYSLFIITVVIAYELTNRYSKKIIYIFYIYFLTLSIFVFLVIFSSFNPDLYVLFIQSDIAKLFINPNVIRDILEKTPVTELSKYKEGVFFINRNVATAFLGINAFLVYGFYIAYSKRWLLIVSLFLFIGVVFARSKAGLIIAICLQLLFLLLSRVYNYRVRKRELIYGFFAILAFIIFALLVRYSFMEQNITEAMSHTIHSRFIIWEHALNEFVKHPFMGLGFGGWQDTFYEYAKEHGIDTKYAPHNTIIYLWAESGIIVVFLAFLFIYRVIAFGFLLIRQSNRELYGLGISIVGAFLWAFLHGMGTNFGLVGDLHMVIILGSILGYSFARYKSFYR